MAHSGPWDMPTVSVCLTKGISPPGRKPQRCKRPARIQRAGRSLRCLGQAPGQGFTARQPGKVGRRQGGVVLELGIGALLQQ